MTGWQGLFRAWLLPSLVVALVLDLIVNGVAHVVLLSTGNTIVMPVWLSAFSGNLLALLVSLSLGILTAQVWGPNRLSALALLLLAVLGILLPVVAPNVAARYVSLLAVITIWLIGTACAFRRRLPFRVYHALAWIVVGMSFGILHSMSGWQMSPLAQQWMVGALELYAILASLAVFSAWATPVDGVSRLAGIGTLLAAAVFAVGLAGFGHRFAAALYATTGITAYLPVPFYVLAAFFVTMPLFDLLLRPETRIRGLGLALVLVGGFGVTSTHQVLIAVLGLGLLVSSYDLRARSLLADWREVLTQQVPPPPAAEASGIAPDPA